MTDDIASRGPQVTARPGTKRHLGQTIARAKFWAIVHVTAKADARRAQAALDAHTARMLTELDPAGNA